MSFKIILLSMFILCLSGRVALAAKEISFNPAKTIETVIGAGELNRIQVKGNEVLEVVGNENKYRLYWSSDWHNLFIVPKTEAGETIDVSLILGGGLAQDVRFTVSDTTGRTIFITNSVAKTAYDRDREASLMIGAMQEGIKGKYYVTELKRTVFKDKFLYVKQLQSWRYKDLTGAVLEVKNRQGGRVSLGENKFRHLFKNVIAVNIETPLLAKWGASRVFVITRNEDKYAS